MDSVAVSFEIAWMISSTGDKTSIILLAISNWFAVRCWMLLSAEYTAKAIFCSKIDSNMYKVDFHLVAASCLSLCLGSLQILLNVCQFVTHNTGVLKVSNYG